MGRMGVEISEITADIVGVAGNGEPLGHFQNFRTGKGVTLFGAVTARDASACCSTSMTERGDPCVRERYMAQGSCGSSGIR